MRKSAFIVLLICVLLLPSLVTHADVILEPENDFFEHNRNDVVYLDRRFTVNSPTGSISVKREPGSQREIATIDNDRTVYVQFSCLYNGDFWGIVTTNPSEQSDADYGWVKMDQLLVLYDYVAFQEDHIGQFYPYEGDYDEVKSASAVIVWPWPGAETPLWVAEDLDVDYFFVSYAYRDERGDEWGFISYLFGHRNIWINLSDPMNSDIDPFNPMPPPRPWVSETDHTDIGGANASRVNPWDHTFTIAIALVAALVVVTLVLIKLFWKPQKSDYGGDGNV